MMLSSLWRRNLNVNNAELPLTEAEIEEMRAERDRVGTHTAESLRLVDRNARAADEVDRLRSLCAQMYQVAGALLFEYEGDFGVEVLDNLSDAASGNPLRHETLLPFVLPENRAKQPFGDAPERTFPIMDDVIKSLPWSMIEPCAEQVSINHYQTLQRISERGGLSPGEAVAVLERRRWRDIPKQEAREQLLAMIQEYEQRAKQALCVECGLPETDDLHNAEIQVAATECPLSTVADQMNFHRFVRRSAEATEEDAWTR